jgi:hypothetical protein
MALAAREIYGDIKVHVTGCNPKVSQVIFGDIEVVTSHHGFTQQILAAPCQDWALPNLEIISKRTLELITEKSEVECNLLAVANRPLTDDDFLPPQLNIQEGVGNVDVVICNGFSKQDVKRWEAKSWLYYEELAKMLMNAGFLVGSIGSQEEYVEGTLDLTGLSFEESLGIIKASKLLISNDTGVYHASNLVGSQNLALFTFTDPVKNYDERFHIYSDILRLDLECSPCMKGVGGDAVWLENKSWCGWKCREMPVSTVFDMAKIKAGEENQLSLPKYMKGVGAYVATLEEGPFLEQVIRTISPMVEKVFVVECMHTWSGADAVRRGRTKAIIDGCGLDNVEYVENPTGAVEDSIETETNQRNWAMRHIESQGFEWIWLVDADEVYDIKEAHEMWKWFRENAKESTKGARLTWHTYWRSLDWIVSPREPYMPSVILRADCVFDKVRVMSSADEMNVLDIPPDVCMIHHFSWARRPEEIRKKIDCGSEFGRRLVSNWYEEKFMGWEQGQGSNFHPTHPECYKSIERRTFDLPQQAKNHPWSRKEVIEDARIVVIILSHNKPENVDKLASQLKPCFAEVEVWDSGSLPKSIPISLTESFDNIYWEGIWQEAMIRYQDYDAVWILGCDITLKDSPERYRQAIESSLPFGCWSPAIDGRAHPFMLEKHYDGRRERVKNIEGMALAISGELIRKIHARFEVSTKIGFGQDYWLCAMARQNELPNYIDGAVSVVHPAGIGYNEKQAHNLMEKAFTERYGGDFRTTLFEYNENFEGNLFKENIKMNEWKKELTIATVDNGWGVKEFERITSQFPQCRRIIMQKGISDFSGETTAEVIPYDEELKEILNADMALFTRIGTANRSEFEACLLEGIPCVIKEGYDGGRIIHQEDGFLYGHESWANGWLEQLIADEGLRLRIGGKASQKASGSIVGENPQEESKEPVEAKEESTEAKEESTEAKKEESTEAKKEEPQSDIKVTVITPTYRRDPKVVSRCLDCVRLQTIDNIEQLVCSDGSPEASIASLVGSIGDKRITYHHTNVKKAGDFGNVVRSEMLKKARGEYILFLDDDNLILPDYLERMIRAIEDSGKDFAVCKVVHFGPLNEEHYGKKPPVVLTGLPVKLFHVDPLQILVKRSAMQEIGWDTEKGYLADGHTLQALGDKFEHVEVSEVLGFHM